MIGSIIIGDRTKTSISFDNIDDFETYIEAIGVDLDSEDIIFTGWSYKLNTLQFNRVNRSQNRRGTDFKQEFVEYIVINCFIPTSGNCFIKCNNHLTGKDYLNDFSTFI